VPVYTAIQWYKKVELDLFHRSLVAKRKRYLLSAIPRKSLPVRRRIAGTLKLYRTVEATAQSTSIGFNDQFQRQLILQWNWKMKIVA
jgi:hypothetical protein